MCVYENYEVYRKAEAQQLHSGRLFFQEKRRAVLGGIRTHMTLCSLGVSVDSSWVKVHHFCAATVCHASFKSWVFNMPSGVIYPWYCSLARIERTNHKSIKNRGERKMSWQNSYSPLARRKRGSVHPGEALTEISVTFAAPARSTRSPFTLILAGHASFVNSVIFPITAVGSCGFLERMNLSGGENNSFAELHGIYIS